MSPAAHPADWGPVRRCAGPFPWFRDRRTGGTPGRGTPSCRLPEPPFSGRLADAVSLGVVDEVPS